MLMLVLHKDALFHYFFLFEDWFQLCIVADKRKDCFQNKSKFITEDYFVQHMNIKIH